MEHFRFRYFSLILSQIYCGNSTPIACTSGCKSLKTYLEPHNSRTKLGKTLEAYVFYKCPSLETTVNKKAVLFIKPLKPKNKLVLVSQTTEAY